MGTVPIKVDQYEKVDELRKQFTKVHFSQVLKNVICEEMLEISQITRNRKFAIKFYVLPESQFSEDLSLKQEEVIEYIEKRFAKILIDAFANAFNKKTKEKLVDDVRVSKEIARRYQQNGAEEEENVDEFEVENAEEQIAEKRDTKGEEDDDHESKNKGNSEGEYDENDNEGDNKKDEESENEEEIEKDDHYDENEDEKINEKVNDKKLDYEMRVSHVKSLYNDKASIDGYSTDGSTYSELTVKMPLTG